MANTFAQCYLHFIFSPKNRDALITQNWKINLEKYISSLIQDRKHKLISINAQPDHIHILIGYYVGDLIPNLVEHIKTSSTHWINENKLSHFKFEWQKGYGVFSYSKSQIKRVSQYIINQDNHHKKKTFKEEYLEILRKNNIEFNEKYLFDFWDE